MQFKVTENDTKVNVIKIDIKICYKKLIVVAVVNVSGFYWLISSEQSSITTITLSGDSCVHIC